MHHRRGNRTRLPRGSRSASNASAHREDTEPPHRHTSRRIPTVRGLHAVPPEQNRFHSFWARPYGSSFRRSCARRPRRGRRSRREASQSCHLPATIQPLSLLAPEAFIYLETQQVFATIASDVLNASAEDICSAVMRWIEEDASRYTHLRNLLLEVRLIFLPIDTLKRLLEHPLVQRNIACRLDVLSAMEYRRSFPPERIGVWKDHVIPFHLESEVTRVYESRFCRPRVSTGPSEIIYVFGSNEKMVGDRNASTMTTVEFYDFREACWQIAEEMPRLREGFAAAAFNGEIWIVGGSSDEQALSTVDIYNPTSDEWREGPSMIKKRCGLGITAYNGNLHAIGGSTKTLDYDSSTEVMILGIGTWIEGAPMVYPRVEMGVAVLRKRIYVIGGAPSAQDSLLEYFCSENNQWTTVPRICCSLNGDCRAVAVYDELLYVMGVGNWKSCIIYNPAIEANTAWISIAVVENACIRRFASVAVVDGCIYLIGGLYSNRRVRAVSRYDVVNEEWTKNWVDCRYVRAGAKAVVIGAND